jgi:hypothetical protein
MRCSCGEGRRHIDCDGGCGCIYVYDENACVCECFDSVSSVRMSLSGATRVNVSIAGLPLGQVATLFDRLLARDVLVPASRVQKKVRLKLEDVSLASALNQLGLSTQKPAGPPKPVTRSKRTK